MLYYFFSLSAIEADMMTISNKLLDEFKAPMDDQNKKELKVHFHSSSYHTIMETVSGLRGVAGHLIKVSYQSKLEYKWL